MPVPAEGTDRPVYDVASGIATIPRVLVPGPGMVPERYRVRLQRMPDSQGRRMFRVVEALRSND